MIVDSEDGEYYYDDDDEMIDEEVQFRDGESLDNNKRTTGNDEAVISSSAMQMESEDPLVTLRAQNTAVLEEIRIIEMTIRDPVVRFKKIRDLAAKHRDIAYKIKKEESQQMTAEAGTSAATKIDPSGLVYLRIDWK